MTGFSSLRARLVGTVFLAIAPAWVLMYLLVKKTGTEQELPWTMLAGGIGLVALAAAWFGGERFVLRQVRALSNAARKLGAGDLSIRTGLRYERGELGQLARTFDGMAQSLEQRVQERSRPRRRCSTVPSSKSSSTHWVSSPWSAMTFPLSFPR